MAAGNTALISCGWDPGLFSLNRLMGNCILLQGAHTVFDIAPAYLSPLDGAELRAHLL